MNPQTARRVVSKTRYLRYLSQKAVLFGSGTFLGMLGIVGAFLCALMLALIFICSVTLWRSDPDTQVWEIVSVMLACLLGGALFVLMARTGARQLKKAERLEPLVPLTRQNAEQLPAEQSLVRASSEPSEVQQAVLLRAAGSDAHTPAHELLRVTSQVEDAQI